MNGGCLILEYPKYLNLDSPHKRLAFDQNPGQRTDFSAGCMRVLIRFSESPGEQWYDILK